MRKRSAVLAAILAVLIVGCATSKVARSPVDQADANYVQIASDYEAAQNIIVAARAQRLVSDQAWAVFDQTQHTVAREAPQARAMLNSWKATGVKPDGFDVALALLTSARDTAVQIQKAAHL